jgi:hypothetical protein
VNDTCIGTSSIRRGIDLSGGATWHPDTQATLNSRLITLDYEAQALSISRRQAKLRATRG